MSRFTFNRKRAKLKKLLGIRARLALLALILVAPLMLERARSLEDARAKQIAHASQEFSDLAQHSADAQREVISSVETDAEVGGLYPRLGGRRRPQLRHPARQPAGQSALDQQPVDRRRRRPGPMLDAATRWSASISATATISRRRGRPATSSSAIFCSPDRDRPADRDGGLSGIRHRRGDRMPSSLPASISTGCRRSWAISAAGPAFRRFWSTAPGPCWRRRRIRPA